MNQYLTFDLAVLAILLVFALWGLHRGLIRTLFSLVAVLVAFVGAILVSNLFAPVAAGWIQPAVTPAVTAAIQTALPEDVADAGLPLEELIVMLEEAGLPMGLDGFLEELREEGIPTLTAGSLAESLALVLTEKLTLVIAAAGLFLIAFVLILILWYFLSRTLDLVAKLPGLHALNKAGGFLCGALKGCIFLFVAVWLVRWFWSDLIPPEAAEQTRVLSFFMTVNPLDILAKL